MPKQAPDLYLSLAASVTGDLDALTEKFRTKPYSYKVGEPALPTEYRCVYVRLDTGSFARIGEEGFKKGELEIELMLENSHTFYEEDLDEIANALGLAPTDFRRWRGREIWKATRQR